MREVFLLWNSTVVPGQGLPGQIPESQRRFWELLVALERRLE